MISNSESKLECCSQYFSNRKTLEAFLQPKIFNMFRDKSDGHSCQRHITLPACLLDLRQTRHATQQLTNCQQIWSSDDSFDHVSMHACGTVRAKISQVWISFNWNVEQSYMQNPSDWPTPVPVTQSRFANRRLRYSHTYLVNASTHDIAPSSCSEAVKPSRRERDRAHRRDWRWRSGKAKHATNVVLLV